MENVDPVLLVSRWLHISSAIIAIGGAVMMRFAILPSASQALDPDAASRFKEAVRRRWARVVHTCIAVLLLTGTYNFIKLALPPKIEPMPYHAVFGVKFVLALAVFVIAAALHGRSPAFAALRQQNRKWLNVLLALAGVIILVSGALSQIRTGVKVAAPDPMQARE